MGEYFSSPDESSALSYYSPLAQSGFTKNIKKIKQEKLVDLKNKNNPSKIPKNKIVSFLPHQSH